MKDIMRLLKAKGAEYADIRITDVTREKINTENMTVQDISTFRSRGAGIRVIYNGAMGFASTQDLNNLEQTALRAIEIAKASSVLRKTKVRLFPKKTIIDKYVTPIKINPFDVSIEEKLELLIRAEEKMKYIDKICRTSASMEFIIEDKSYCDTEGSYITQKIYISGAGIEASAFSDNDVQTRSYPNSFGGGYFTGGFEVIKSLCLVENAERTARAAALLVDADKCPSGYFDLVIDGSQLSIQIHESIGHALELDRILGTEAAFAGRSFVEIMDIEKGLEYGSELINVTADANIPGGLGTFGYDDDGVKAQKVMLIQNGILKNVLSSRETGASVHMPSNGTSIAEEWCFMPLVRMTNINLLPGKSELEELISGIDNGLYICTNKSWSIDDIRANFQFGCEIAYEIKKGKLTGKIFKNAVYSGSTLDFWRKCDGICSEKYWEIFGVPNCVKGQPLQTSYVSHGAAPGRFRNIKVGV